MQEYLQSIAEEIKDIFDHEIIANDTYSVPSRDDTSLSFGRNQIKRGKLIKTCVLFIDIRNSTSVSRRYKRDKTQLGKIYSAFIHAMVKTADEFGYVRNIIGDRIMVVFEPDNCFVNAINCATAMYSICNGIIKKISGLDNFKVGIGIEYGEMLILKTGITKKNEERSEYKNLVWVGDAANIASKLTDKANKELNSISYDILYNEHSFEKVFKSYFPIPVYETRTSSKQVQITLTSNEFHNKVELINNILKYEGKTIMSISKKSINDKMPPVLMSSLVYKEYKKSEPSSTLLRSLGIISSRCVPFTGDSIYGGILVFKEINKIKL